MKKDQIKEKRIEEQQVIEFWENEYLEQIAYLVETDKEKMLNGFKTKEDIRNDWEKYLGAETSDFAVGSERIFYWIFNQFGIPNSSPVGSDLFFETYNAYVHIDIKTVTLGNIGDFTKNIFIGDNQNSYIGTCEVTHRKGGKKEVEYRPYKGNLPTYYTKKDGERKICLTYFLLILYDENNLDIQAIVLTCMPNGKLGSIYGSKVLSAGKNPGKVRFNYTAVPKFELLRDKYRSKILLWNENMNEHVKKRLSALEPFHDINQDSGFKNEEQN